MINSSEPKALWDHHLHHWKDLAMPTTIRRNEAGPRSRPLRGTPLVVPPLVLLAASLVAVSAPAPALALECPQIHELEKSGVTEEQKTEVNEISALLAGDDLDNRLHEIVTDIRARHPDASDADLVDLLTAAYCPVIERKEDMSESEKTAAMDAFAKRTSDLLQGDRPE